jgi:hypothetical protein
MLALGQAGRARAAGCFEAADQRSPGAFICWERKGGNIAASVGKGGIVMVDDQYAPLADKIQVAVKNLGITDKPVQFVISTPAIAREGTLRLRMRVRR